MQPLIPAKKLLPARRGHRGQAKHARKKPYVLEWRVPKSPPYDTFIYKWWWAWKKLGSYAARAGMDAARAACLRRMPGSEVREHQDNPKD